MGRCRVRQRKAGEVEQWLRSLSLAPSTKNKLRNHLSVLFSHAIRHEMYEKLNPIRSVRQGSKRVKTPDILSLNEVGRISSGLNSMLNRTAVLVAAVTGLRRSEIRGLKWRDFNFDSLWLTLKCGRVRKHNTKLKTDASRRGIPIHRNLPRHYWSGRASPCTENPKTGSSRPPQYPVEARYGWTSCLKPHPPAARAAGIDKTIGWHTFRRSLGTLLDRKARTSR